MEEALTSQARSEAYGGADYSDGISLQDVFATVGNTLPHIALATAGTVIAGPGAGGFGAVISGKAGFMAATASYLGTISMGLQMYGDNYNSAIEENLKDHFYQNPSVKKKLIKMEDDVLLDKTSSFKAAYQVLEEYFKKKEK